MKKSPERNAGTLLALMLVGETVFVLPFVLARVFRPTLLDVFGLSNLQLGAAFSAYGSVAMVSYLFGGPLADRFAPRSLISLALLATAAGGLIFARIPSVQTLALLYGFWGLSTILLFWAPLMRATRQWGGESAQGVAFGMLDGGRGLLAALLASGTVALFAMLMPADSVQASAAQRADALQHIILVCSAFTAALGLLAWWVLPDQVSGRSEGDAAFDWKEIGWVSRYPAVWLQALIILCAYLGYKVTDNFSLYARDVHGYGDVAAAQLGAVAFWMRPIAALAAGWMADRIDPTRVLIIGFGVLLMGSLAMATQLMRLDVPLVLVATVLTTCLGVYAVRGVYYAVMGEARIPLAVTGSAVGLVSVVGFTPDIFAGPLFGYLLDRAPGVSGHQQVFLVVAVAGFVGLMVSIGMRRYLQASADPR